LPLQAFQRLPLVPADADEFRELVTKGLCDEARYRTPLKHLLAFVRKHREPRHTC
jgi:hypothetical protein